MKNQLFLLPLGLISLTSYAAGVPFGFTYQGKVMRPDGAAPLSAVVSLKVDIMDPTGSCILYEEKQTEIDLTETNGQFTIKVGSDLNDPKRVIGSDPGLSMVKIFSNSGEKLVEPTGKCMGYTPAAKDHRILRVTVINGAKETQIKPDIQINSVPNSFVSESVQGLSAKDIVSSSPTSVNGERVERAWIKNNGKTCTIVSQSGSWLLKPVRKGLGKCSFTITPNEFSSAPTCVVMLDHQENALGAFPLNSFDSSITKSNLGFVTMNLNRKATDYNYQLICMGSR